MTAKHIELQWEFIGENELHHSPRRIIDAGAPNICNHGNLRMSQQKEETRLTLIAKTFFFNQSEFHLNIDSVGYFKLILN